MAVAGIASDCFGLVVKRVLLVFGRHPNIPSGIASASQVGVDRAWPEPSNGSVTVASSQPGRHNHSQTLVSCGHRLQILFCGIRNAFEVSNNFLRALLFLSLQYMPCEVDAIIGHYALYRFVEVDPEP